MSDRNVLVRGLAAIWRAIDGVRKVLHLIVLLFVFSIIVAALTSSAPSLPAKAALQIPLYGNLVEQLEGDPFDRALAELMDDVAPQVLVRDVVAALDYAADDPRIKVVVLDLGGLGGGGLSKARRIADALVTFRESGKLVIAHADYFSQTAYYLAAHADEVYIHPQGYLGLQGYGVYSNYFKDAIDKLKIDWNVFRVGTHKSFVEPYTRNDMSDEDRSSMSRILGQLWGLYKDGVSTARGIPADGLDEWVASLAEDLEQPGNTVASLAVAAGLVDAQLTRQQLRERIASLAGRDDESALGYQAAGLGDYVAQMRLLDSVNDSANKIAVVVASGEILNGYQPPGTIGGESTAELLMRARLDDEIKAVLLRVDSPGGSSFASEIIRHEVLALKAAGKPVVASLSSSAASGGYWISMAADRIVASEATITGSIGIFGMYPTFQRSLAALGIYTDGVGTSALAGTSRADREMTDESKRIAQATVDDGYDQFIGYVADHRGMRKEAVDRVAQGQIWTGRDALDNGLIDEIGDFEYAVSVAAELASLAEGDYSLQFYEPDLSPAEMLALQFLGGAQAIGVDIADFRSEPTAVRRLATLVESTLRPLTRFNDPRGVYAHCLCRFD
ncbi:signal peptide peptidase SppA [Woeseia oceani]|uniref:signal peptide peptidase SppA n=1 Tax=Woeseia oceani TaxID=1548547 RepID=UPI000A9A2E75|nr:signal peptide peptidase SppA [Woeseia oceani]